MSAIIDKVRKLLRLAESPNAHEAALAAAKAQTLIDEHNLTASLLSLDTATPEQDEPIEDFQKKGAPLDERGRDVWKSHLASAISRANACRIYLQGGQIALVGRPSDAAAVRYLYAYLSREVERLCEKDGRGCGRTWRNNYRLGVVDTISRKLREERERFKREAQKAVESNTQALVRMNTALAKVEQRSIATADWVKANLKLRSYSGSSAAYNPNARNVGRKAGESIRVGGQSGRLGAGARGALSE